MSGFGEFIKYKDENVKEYANWLWLIRLVHYVTVIFLITAPFLPSELLLTYHAITVPFLWMHWITNNDVCALTVLESAIRKRDRQHTFLGSLINPIFQIQNKHFYYATGILFIITMIRLYYTYEFGLARQTYSQFSKILNLFFPE